MRTPCGAILVAMALAAHGGADVRAADRTVCFNEDNEHFYAKHSAEDMTREGCRALVDAYARTGTIRSLLFCVNLQRALYDSDVWERFRDLPPDTQYVRNLRLLSARGVDQFAEWLDRCRETGVEGWLTMRMNDCHGLKEAARGMPSRLASWHSRRWEEHPEWRRAPWRDERSWEGAWDWSHKEVRDYALALVREILGRWDLCGLELDWMRWGMYFRPGNESEGRALLTDFVREVRRLADEAAERLGHPVRLAHRVPVTPEACLGLGFDVVAWSKCGAVDMLTLSEFGNEAVAYPPVDVWRGMLKPGTRINVAVGSVATPHAASRVLSHEILRGSAAAAWSAGADGAYFFNECYREPEEMDVLERDLRAAASPGGVAADTRRIVVTSCTTVVPGMSAHGGCLHAPLSQAFIGVDFSRMEQNLTFRIPAGPLAPGTEAVLELAFDKAAADIGERLRKMPVRVNCKAVEPCGAAEPVDQGRVDPSNVFQRFEDWPRDAALALCWCVPVEILKSGDNAVEILPPAAAPGNVVWCALRLAPPRKVGERFEKEAK